MAACRNFFDESSSGLCRSSSLSDRTCISPTLEGKEEDGAHCLELTLGLGPCDLAASSPPQYDMVRPNPYLHKQPSGHFAPSTPAIAVDGSELSFAQVDLSEAPHTLVGQADVDALAKQRSGNFASYASTGNGGHTLSSTFAGQTDAALAVKALLPSGDSAFPSRDQIWQSLQKNGTSFERNTQQPDDASSMWSRRSASMQVVIPRKDVGDVETHQIRRSCSNGGLPRTLSCQLSNIDSSLERNPRQDMVSQHHPQQQEALEDLQKRKEMQAHRRQVARKRRKTLIEEKQHKKNRQGSTLQRTSSRQIAPPDDKFSHVRTPSIEDDVASESQFASPNDSKPAKPENQGKVNMMQNLYSEEARQEVHGKCVIGGKLLTSGNEYNHGSYFSLPAVMGTTGQAGIRMNEDEEAKSCPSSETECAENSSIQNEISEFESLGQKSASEFGGVGVTVSSVFSTSGMAKGPMGYPPFPFSPIPYGHTVAGATTTTVPMQANFPFPYFMQYPAPSKCENDPPAQSLPTLHGVGPLVAATFTGTFPPFSGAVISKTSFPGVPGEGIEGKRGGNEKSAFTPLRRTEEREDSNALLESQVSLPASQLSSLTGVASDASEYKSLSLERQQSRPLGGRLLSQNSSIQDLCIAASSKQERPIRGQRGMDVPHATPTLTMVKAEVKQEEGIKQEEGSSESQLASEHSGVDVSYAQSGVAEKQKSGSFPDLPWVTTTGKGPNGKTINGVMYIANGRIVRLVCSCHGKHMSPAEFVEHSGSTDLSYPERNIVVSPFPSLNHQLASTPA